MMKATRLATYVFLGVVALSSIAQAQSYGPKEKRVGAGILLGEPSGITLKGYLASRLALDGSASWSFVDGAILFMGDVTYDCINLAKNSSTIKVPFYAGGGGLIGSDRRGTDKGRTVAGVRIPLGVAFQFINYPVEVFVEVGPGLKLAPETKALITGGVGARFYF